MKALIISEDLDFAQKTNTYLENKGINTITYKWFIKALDNIEEISPDFIVINKNFYPRHWKILGDFCKGLYLFGLVSKQIVIKLISDDSVSSEDLNKIQILQNIEVFASIEDITIENGNSAFPGEDENLSIDPQVDEILDKISEDEKEEIVSDTVTNEVFENTLENNIEATLEDSAEELSEENATEELSEENATEKNAEELSEEDFEVPTVDAIFNKNGKFLLTNPNTGSFLCGKLEEIEKNKLKCYLDTQITDLNLKDKVECLTIMFNDEYQNLTGNILELCPEENALVISVS